MFHSYRSIGVVCYSIFGVALYRPILISNNDIIRIMSAQDWAGFILTVISILGAVGIALRWIMKKYIEEALSELKPNSGSSMKDQVTRLEDKMDKMFDMMIAHLQDHSNK